MKSLGKAEIEDGHIVVRVAIDGLDLAANSCWAANILDCPIKVVDAQSFAKAMCDGLNAEQTGRLGNSLISDALDAAMIYAIESGEGEDISEQEAERIAAAYQD